MGTRVRTGLRWRHDDVTAHTATRESCDWRRRRDHVVVGWMWRWRGRRVMRMMIVGRSHVARFRLSAEWRHHGAGARNDRARPPWRSGDGVLTSRKELSRGADLLTLSLILTPLGSSVLEPHLNRRHRRYTDLNCNAQEEFLYHYRCYT